MRLTDVGQAYLPAVRNAFRQISEATRRAAAPAATGLRSVCTTPFFASAWLAPRLTSFQEACPDIDLRVTTSNALTDVARDGVDVAIRHGLGACPGLRSLCVAAVEVSRRSGRGF